MHASYYDVEISSGRASTTIPGVNLVASVTLVSGNLRVDGYCRPDTDVAYDLGGSSYRWNNIYCRTASINTSDIREKKDVYLLEPEKMKAFVMALNPVSYRWIDGESGREHYGLIAQEVKEAMTGAGIADFGGFVKTMRIPVDEEGNGGLAIPYDPEAEDDQVIYGLRYEELIAPMIATIQEQQLEIDALKDRIERLESLILKGG